MTSQLTYLQFHLAFLVPIAMFLIATGFVSRSRLDGLSTVRSTGRHSYWVGVAIITVIALAYTTPWDNYLIARGVWRYGDGSTLATLGYAPIGEYLFILVQPWVTALWLAHLSLPATWPSVTRPIRSRIAAVVLAAGIGIGGLWLLGTAATFYLGAILAWAAPVLALQWAVGAPQLVARRRLVALGVAVPTLYLSIVDRIAIEYGIWILSPEYTTGIYVAGLPIEEGLFFLVTNLFVVQGLVLYGWVTDRWLAPDGERRSIPRLRSWTDREV
ncbi:lycopene cyclase domain-containing protein [Halobellus ordinarius]|uniref:lycopene cyclase domain-containing protein n=1 Tax=Halobellus ordinarius TaxID=3075120 RepID=UPI0028806C60|nr:lycopene cyclase domain-containing protein [Halobellus sp. ZY16]